MSSTAPNTNGDGETTMTTDDDSLSEVGRDLLRAELERVSEEDIRDAFREASARLAQGEELTRGDIRAMREAIREAERVLEQSARASAEATPLPDLWEFLDDQSREAYVREVERRQDL